MATSNDLSGQQQKAILLLLYTTTSQAARLVEGLPNGDCEIVTSPLSVLVQQWIQELQPDLILLEPPAEKRKLLQACETLRAWTERPIIVLSGEKDEIVIARAFAAGIDEYLLLPVGIRELAARIEAMLRRFSRYAAASDITDGGGLVLSSSDLSVLCRGRRVSLSPIEFRLLSCLISAVGRVVTHEALMLRAWGAEYVDSRHYLHLYIRYLREKLEEDPANPKMILSEWGVGYRLQPLDAFAS